MQPLDGRAGRERGGESVIYMVYSQMVISSETWSTVAK